MDRTILLPVLPRRGIVDIVVFGENSLDVVGTVPSGSDRDEKVSLDSFAFLPGGQAATAALGCARLGARTRYVGAFGDDAWGRIVQEALKNERVDVVAIDRPSASSRLAIVLVDRDSGHRKIYERRDPALAIDVAALPPHTWTDGRLLLVDATDVRASVAATALARRHDIPTIVDVDRWSSAVAPLLANVDVIIVAQTFLIGYAPGKSVGQALRDLMTEFQARAAVVTLGDEGSLAVSSEHEVRHRAFAVDVVDTTGAGDAFRAGFAYAWLQSDAPDLEDLLTFANATAALNCRALGAMTGLPTVDEVRALVAARR